MTHFIIRRIKELIILFKYYNFSTFRKNKKQLFVAFFDNKRNTFGLTDRLKGAISLYAFSKIKNAPYKLVFTYPFDLSLFFMPNQYEWLANENEISNYVLDTKLLIVQGENGKRLLNSKTKKQLHVYINRDYLPLLNETFNTNFEWRELFYELFKPTEKLNAQINYHLSRINSDYIACVFRFQALIGDFKEYNFPILPSGEQQDLIKTCTEVLCSLRAKHNLPILVTSDSFTFLSHISELDNIFIIPGEIVHIDCTYNAAEDVYMKSFIDFMMCSKASKIYNIVTGQMYSSEFPLYAAKVNNVPFERIII